MEYLSHDWPLPPLKKMRGMWYFHAPGHPLAKAPDAERARDTLPEVKALVRRQPADLKRRRVPLEKLIVHQTLSRELEARQLAEYDKDLRPGQVVRFVYTLGKPGVRARCARRAEQQDYRCRPLFHSTGARRGDDNSTFLVRWN
jgi:hypothetical protein